MAVKKQVIELPRIKLQTIELTVESDSALICHAWAEKAKKEMLDKQMKKAKGAKAAKDPFTDYVQSLYWLNGDNNIRKSPKKPTEKDFAQARFAFPAMGFKSAAVDACSYVDGVTKVAARGAFHICADWVEIKGKPSMREDMVRIGMGTADIRYRGEFREWRASFKIRFNMNVLSAEQIINLFNIAGFAIGVGEWRPQKDGSFGMFHVVGGD